MTPPDSPNPAKVDASAPTGSGGARLAAMSAFAALAICVFTLAFTPLRASHDEWWHLKTGRWIDEHGIPETEIFTYTAEGMPWHNHEWLSEWFFWRVFRRGELEGWGGLRTLVTFKTAFLLATYLGMAALLARSTGAPAASAFALVLAAGLSRRTFYPRPPFLTYGLMAFLLLWLQSWRDRRRGPLWLLLPLPPLFAVWANLHGGFMAGLVVLGAFWAESAIAPWLAKWRKEDPRPEFRRFGAITAALALSVAGTLLTPSGIELYLLPGRVLNDARLDGIIFELLPADWRMVWVLDACIAAMLFAAIRPRSPRTLAATAAAAIFLLAIVRGIPGLIGPGAAASLVEVWGREAIAAAVFLAAGFRAGRYGPADAMLVLFFAHQGIHHVRHLPLLAIVLAPSMARAFAEWGRWPARAWDAAWGARPLDIHDPAAKSEREAAGLRRIERASALLATAAAAFYALCPGEAHYLLRPESAGAGVTRAEMLRAPSFLSRNAALARGVEMEPRDYPVRACDFLIQNDLPGRIWNGGNYAGYLIWRLSPEKHKVFTDNRYDIWGGDFIVEELTVRDALPRKGNLPGWEDVLAKWKVRTLFLSTADPIQRKLETDREHSWRQVFNDGRYSIWTRSGV